MYRKVYSTTAENHIMKRTLCKILAETFQLPRGFMDLEMLF
jgi:hypothetical protein